MKWSLVAIPVAAAGLVVACSTETTTITTVTNAGGEGGPGDSAELDGGVDIDSATSDGAETDGGLDASTDGPAMCVGPPAKGVGSTTCTIFGACTLPGCAGGTVYICDQPNATTGGFPIDLSGLCVHSASDSSPANPWRNCCPPTCLRLANDDSECVSTGVGTRRAFVCPVGAVEPAKCKPHPEARRSRRCTS